MAITIVSFTQVDGSVVKVNPVYVTHFRQVEENCTALFISNCNDALWVQADAQTVENELTGVAAELRRSNRSLRAWQQAGDTTTG